MTTNGAGFLSRGNDHMGGDMNKRRPKFFSGFESLSQEQYYFKMVDRTFKLICEQLALFFSGKTLDENDAIKFAKWSTKVRKSY